MISTSDTKLIYVICDFEMFVFQVVRCPPLVTFLKDQFRDRRRYKFEVVPSSSNDVSFKRLTSNISQVRELFKISNMFSA